MTNSLHMLTCIIILILIQGCGSSENHQRKDSGETTKSDTVSMNNDSLPTPPKPAPSPGHARIRAQIAGVQESASESDIVIITFHIAGIEEYGPSTPPLAVRDSVKVKARKSTVEKKKISSGKIVTAVISYRQVILGYGESPRWSLVELD